METEAKDSLGPDEHYEPLSEYQQLRRGSECTGRGKLIVQEKENATGRHL